MPVDGATDSGAVDDVPDAVDVLDAFDALLEDAGAFDVDASAAPVEVVAALAPAGATVDDVAEAFEVCGPTAMPAAWALIVVSSATRSTKARAKLPNGCAGGMASSARGLAAERTCIEVASGNEEKTPRPCEAKCRRPANRAIYRTGRLVVSAKRPDLAIPLS